MRLTSQCTVLAITLSCALSACSLATGLQNRLGSSTSNVEASVIQSSTTRALVLPDPTVTEAPNKTIDLNTLGANATVNVTYPAVATGHTVSVWWTGKNTYKSPVQTVGAAGPLTFTVPKANIAADTGSSGVLTYSVGVDNSPIEVSNRLSINVIGNAVPATFPKPVAPQAQAGKLNLSTLGANVTVNVTYPTITSGHNVGLRWTGKSQYNATVQLVGTARPVVFTVPTSAVAGDVGGNGVFTYSVGIGLEPLKISEALSLEIINSASSGDAIAAAINARYLDTRAACPNNLPAYYCNGVIIRATENGAYDPWNPSALSTQLGGISFSYMRADAHVQNLYHNSGFTFLSQSEATAQGKPVEYLCVYAYDAGTLVGARGNRGCGLKPRNFQLADISTCAGVGVQTVDQWYAYTRTILNRDYQCSLSTASPEQFMVSLKVRENRPPNMEALWNEVMVKVWAQNIPTQLPLESFFYKNAPGLAEAKIYQSKYKTRTGLWLPIIRLNLSQLNGNPFSYTAGDQAVQP
ncbi:hypothetical protein K3169_07775 [Pseudomonas phytophila]|uniref:Uncharacterized protein n=1 Tax=Pseudomonas phytophila TaxID=2867264 RepID=A0ABY6FJ22_9PSED|nr:hypothetical protein [Pseudomonas phytophila]UXZ97771.1 hypothetical protein K3169_07775 [Pseudomonas phytophila]